MKSLKEKFNFASIPESIENEEKVEKTEKKENKKDLDMNSVQALINMMSKKSTNTNQEKVNSKKKK